MKRLFAAALLLSLALGCSTVKSWMPGGDTPTPGDQMLSQSKQAEVLGKTWNEGQQMVEKGQKLMSKSEKLSIEAQQARTEAEGLIAQGNTLISGSQKNYRTAFGTPVDTLQSGSSSRQ